MAMRIYYVLLFVVSMDIIIELINSKYIGFLNVFL